MAKTIRRDTLKKMIENGKIEAKCTFKLTDDYVFDNAYNFGKTEWLPARLARPTYEEITLHNGNKITQCTDSDHKDGYANFNDWDFSKGAKAYLADDGTISFRVSSNEHYTLRKV